MRRALLLAGLLLAASAAATPRFGLHYEVRFLPEEDVAEVRMRIRSDQGARVRWLDLAMPERRYALVAAEGETRRSRSRLRWSLPSAGGELVYRYRIDRRRGGAMDARLDDRLALVRGDRLFPPARLRATRGARSRTTVAFRLPPGWSVETPYPREGEDRFVVEWPRRRLARPVGWIIAGDLGVRREYIDGTQWVVAAPRGERMRRQDLLALLRILHPHLFELTGSLPDKFLIVGAGDGFWRGGLSGPRSLYLHVDRPLIQEDGTSPLAHELVHSLTRIRGVPGERWIAEAFAEYYAVELIHRAGLIGEARRQRIWRGLERRARDVAELSGRRCSGSCVAAAAVELRTLERSLRRAAPDGPGIDEVTRRLAARAGAAVSPAEVLAVASAVAGRELPRWPRRAVRYRGSADGGGAATGVPSAAWSMK